VSYPPCSDCGKPLARFALRCGRCERGEAPAAPAPGRDLKPAKMIVPPPAPSRAVAPCPVCQGVVPPSHGPRPRVYCSDDCKKKGLAEKARERVAAANKARVAARPDVLCGCGCGAVVKQLPGVRERFYASSQCRVRALNRKRYAKPAAPDPAVPPPMTQLLLLARDAIAWGQAVLEANGETP
jgi:hypothetical protein